MSDLSRRDLLIAGATIAASTAMPSIPTEAARAVVGPVTPPLPAWIAGSPGEFDWLHVVGLTERDARIAWACEQCGEDECENGTADGGSCDCEFCGYFHGAEVIRMKAWDGREPTPGDWLRAGLGHSCSRCGYETFLEAGGYAVGSEAVCEDCMTLADWDIADPERAAEIRAASVD